MSILYKINLEDIPDQFFKRILSEFLETKSPLVIWGGAVRDLIFSKIYPSKYKLQKLINDIDIAIILDSNIKDRKLYYRDCDENFRLLPIMKKSWSDLCRKWKKQPEDFCDIDDTEISGFAYPISMMGLRTVYDSNGNMYPDCFALSNFETFNAVPSCFSINCFAMDGFGNIYGPRRFYSDFQNRVARMMNPPLVSKRSLPQTALPRVLRAINYIRRFDLTFEKQTELIFYRHLHDLNNSPKLLEDSLKYPLVQKLLEKEFGPAIHGVSPPRIINYIMNSIKNFPYFSKISNSISHHQSN